MLHQAGWIVDVKRVERIWRREGLKMRKLVVALHNYRRLPVHDPLEGGHQARWMAPSGQDQPGRIVSGGVEKVIAAVRNAIVSPWSNGQAEGQITCLKSSKCQMYGRAKLDRLQARLIGAT